MYYIFYELCIICRVVRGNARFIFHITVGFTFNFDYFVERLLKVE